MLQLFWWFEWCRKPTYTEKSSNLQQVTDTLCFIRLYQVHLTMGSEQYKYKEKTSNIPQVTDTLYFIRLRRVHLTICTGSENISTKRKPVTFRRWLTYFISLCCIEYTWPWEVKNIRKNDENKTYINVLYNKRTWHWFY